jgi:hypothetical protein
MASGTRAAVPRHETGTGNILVRTNEKTFLLRKGAGCRATMQPSGEGEKCSLTSPFIEPARAHARHGRSRICIFNKIEFLDTAGFEFGSDFAPFNALATT